MVTSYENELSREVDEILAHELFTRAPTQSRLLRYLAERSIDPLCGQVTQYDIAIEGLGRDTNYDDSSESHSRVQISRLRSNLAAYYSRRAPLGSGCIYIRHGEYKLKLGRLEYAYPDLHSKTVQNSPSAPDQELRENKTGILATLGRRKAFATGVLAGLSIFLIISLAPGQREKGQSSSALTISAPTVEINVEPVGYARSLPWASEFKSVALAEARERLARSIVASQSHQSKADYLLSLEFDADTDGHRWLSLSLTNGDGMSVYRAEQQLVGDLNRDRETLGWKIASIFSPPGVLARSIVKQIPEKPRNDFECLLFTEVGRSDGQSVGGLASWCLANFPDSRYLPYFRAREIFQSLQREMVRGRSVTRASSQWKDLGELLRDYPDNPYLNAIAAKLLYVEGDCDEALRHRTRALESGRDYPALELAISVESGGCLTSNEDWDALHARIEKVVVTQHEPHALLEAYAIAGLIMTNHADAVDLVPARPFTFEQERPLVDLANDLREFASGKRASAPPSLKALVWSASSRRKISEARPLAPEKRVARIRS